MVVPLAELRVALAPSLELVEKETAVAAGRPVGFRFPAASFGVRVTVIEFPEATLEDEALSAEVATLYDPGFTVTVCELDTATELMVAERVRLPDSAPVKLAV